MRGLRAAGAAALMTDVPGALAQGARLLGTALAVALAVTLVSGTFILTDTIDASFHQASAETGGGSDVVVRSTALFAAQAARRPKAVALAWDGAKGGVDSVLVSWPWTGWGPATTAGGRCPARPDPPDRPGARGPRR